MKKCVIIYNPNSGKKVNKDFLAAYLDILMDNDYDPEVIISKYRGHITKIVSELRAVDLVISLGGDGTFNEAMNGNFLRKERLLLAHIPLGTTNDVGAMFGYGKDPISNLQLLLDGEIKEVDVCCVNGKPFVYVAGFGKFMNVPYETSRELKKKIGYLAYLVEGIKEFKNTTKLYELSYQIDDEVYHGLYSFMIISNANRIAGINNFYNDVKLDDGKFEVLFCNLTRKKDILKTLYYLSMNDITKVPGFYFHKTDNLKITFKNKVSSWCVDGEKLEEEEKEYNITVKPKVKIMMPKKNIENLFQKKSNRK